MNYFIFLLTVVIGILGVSFGITGFTRYTNITRTANKVSLLQIIIPAVQSGIASSLIFFAIISSLSIFDSEYIWDLQKLGGAIFISLTLGTLVTAGGINHIYKTVILRDMLIRKYRGKDVPERYDDS
jgi:hypothetical protein